MFAVRCTAPSRLSSQTFAPWKWVIPFTVSSTSASVITSPLPGTYVIPEGSGLGGESAPMSTVLTSAEVKSIAAGAMGGASDSSTIWPEA